LDRKRQFSRKRGNFVRVKLTTSRTGKGGRVSGPEKDKNDVQSHFGSFVALNGGNARKKDGTQKGKKKKLTGTTDITKGALLSKS